MDTARRLTSHSATITALQKQLISMREEHEADMRMFVRRYKGLKSHNHRLETELSNLRTTLQILVDKTNGQNDARLVYSLTPKRTPLECMGRTTKTNALAEWWSTQTSYDVTTKNQGVHEYYTCYESWAKTNQKAIFTFAEFEDTTISLYPKTPGLKITFAPSKNTPEYFHGRKLLLKV